MFRKVLVLATAAAALAAAPAANAMTIRMGDAQLSAKMAITVPVTVSCSPFDPDWVLYSTSITVNAQQAAGKNIAYGFGSVGSGFGGVPPAWSCDGTDQTLPVTVLANTAGAPFHGGKAVLSATGYVQAAQPCYPGAENCWMNFTSQSASTGAVVAHL